MHLVLSETFPLLHVLLIAITVMISIFILISMKNPTCSKNLPCQVADKKTDFVLKLKLNMPTPDASVTMMGCSLSPV